MRLHVVSLPHTQATADFPSCAFTQKVRRFCRMMSDRGHEVLLYAGERTDAPCVELIPCISENKRRKMVGGRHYTEADWSHPYWNGFNARVIDAMEERLGFRRLHLPDRRLVAQADRGRLPEPCLRRVRHRLCRHLRQASRLRELCVDAHGLRCAGR
jgi:hypothetical protein